MKVTIPLSILLPLLLISCYKDVHDFKISNLNDNRITILGHRGMGKKHKYPGNSFESIETAIKLGADGSEIDVQITKDSVLVIFHDKEMSNKTNFQGMIRDYNWAEIVGCNYQSASSEQFSVITVDDLFSRIPNIQEYYFSFDCKFYPEEEKLDTYLRQFAYAIEQVIEKHNMHNQVMIESEIVQFHQILKQNGVQALQFIVCSKVTEGIRIAEQLDLYGIGKGSAITKRDIELAHEKGFRVMTWIPKTKWGNVKAIRKNPDFIQTAKLIHLLKIFGRYRQ